MVVSKYTYRRLTYRSDKLVAISALARHVHETFGSGVEYLAGLWRVHLPYQLLWTSGGPNASRSENYIALSWSWASIDVKVINPCVVYYEDDREILIKIKDASIEHASEDRFGPVIGGRLLISGRLTRVAVYTHLPAKSGSSTIFIALDCLISAQEHGAVKKDCPQNSAPGIITRNLYFLSVRKLLGSNCTIGLILEPVEGIGEHYRRFGIYEES